MKIHSLVCVTSLKCKYACNAFPLFFVCLTCILVQATANEEIRPDEKNLCSDLVEEISCKGGLLDPFIYTQA